MFCRIASACISIAGNASVMAERYRPNMPPRPAPRDLRASDSDRERVVSMLGEALADGRLSHEEYSERMPLALAARTLGDLAGLTTARAAPEHQPLLLEGGQQVAALFTTADRRGRWVVPA